MSGNYISIENSSDNITQANFSPDSVGEAEYKRLTAADTKDIGDIRVFRNVNGDQILMVITNRSPIFDNIPPEPVDPKRVYMDDLYYQPINLQHGDERPAVNLGKSFSGSCTRESAEYWMGNDRLYVTLDKMVFVSNDKSVEFEFKGSDLSLAKDLYDFNPDQRQINDVLQNEDQTIVITRPVNQKRGNFDYDFKVYGVKDGKISFESDAEDVQMFRDGGTRMGKFRENGQSSSFYIPAPQYFDRSAQIGNRTATLLGDQKRNEIQDAFATELHLVRKQQNLLSLKSLF